jgi:hypothetical protein
VKLYARVKDPFFLLIGFGVFSIFGGGIFVVYHFDQLDDQNPNEIFVDINQTFRLQLTHNGRGEVFGDGYYKFGSKARIRAIPDLGYSFKRWATGKEDFNFEEANTTIPISSDINLTAIFVQNEFHLKADEQIHKSFEIRDLEGLDASVFDPKTGLPSIKVSYSNADVEKPRVGFLKMGLAFLMVRNLSVDLYADRLDNKSLNKEFAKLRSQKGVSYAVAEPITINIRSKRRTVCISAGRGKLTNSGVLRLWDGVEFSEGDMKDHFPKGEILTSDEMNCIYLVVHIDGKQKHIQLD